MSLPCPIRGWRILGSFDLGRFNLAITTSNYLPDSPRWVLQFKGSQGEWQTVASGPMCERQAHRVLDLGLELAEHFKAVDDAELSKAQ